MKIRNMSAGFHGIIDYFSIKTMKICSMSAEFHDYYLFKLDNRLQYRQDTAKGIKRAWK
ncbi:MAG: hypothetical protein IJY53_01250 [Akkermansia sp.]|nr:hypothetical protein [Akkermansia sp.]